MMQRKKYTGLLENHLTQFRSFKIISSKKKKKRYKGLLKIPEHNSDLYALKQIIAMMNNLEINSSDFNSFRAICAITRNSKLGLQSLYQFGTICFFSHQCFRSCILLLLSFKK